MIPYGKVDDKYLPGGGLNPFWVEKEIRNNRGSDYDEGDVILEIVEEEEDDDEQASQYSLEEKFQFLKNHSDSEEDLNLAKQILGIK